MGGFLSRLSEYLLSGLVGVDDLVNVMASGLVELQVSPNRPDFAVVNHSLVIKVLYHDHAVVRNPDLQLLEHGQQRREFTARNAHDSLIDDVND